MNPPSIIAHYRIVSKLGEGGMGAVYRATDTKLNRDVAIKVLPPAFAADAARMQRFEREAQVLASLNHPNIAAIYGIEEGAIVMELVDGADLAGPLPLDTAIHYARQIAAGLEAAHEKGIVHRDLKPANIKVTPDGTVKILDFGLAKTTEQAAASSAMGATVSPTLSLEMTQAGMILGTAAYMSPEQARGKPTDKRADIWAFGVVLYEMIAGRRAFEGEDVAHTMAAVIMQEPSFDGIPASLHALLKSCLEKDPKKRLRDIGDVWRLMDGQSSAPVANVRPAPAGFRLTLAVSIVAALALAAAGALAFLHFREQPPAAPVTRFSIAFGTDVVQQPAISPDGRLLVVSTTVVGQGQHLVLRSLDNLESRTLPGTDTAIQPFWSPDSRYIGFSAVNKLKFLDSHGGPAQSLAEVSGFRGGAWSSDGTILYASNSAPLKYIRSSGGTPADALAVPMRASAPVFLPDGRHFLFTATVEALDQGGIFLGSLDRRDPENRQPRRLLPDLSRAVLAPAAGERKSAPDRLILLFVRDNTLMGVGFDAKALHTSGDAYPVAERVARAGTLGFERFAASFTGTLVYEAQTAADRKLTWYDRQGKELGTVGDPGSYRSVSLSPDGTQLAVDREVNGNADIWLYDQARDSKIRLTSDASAETNPLWSPDGKSIAFNSGRDNKQAIYRKPASGAGNDELMVADPGTIYDWSRDGKYLAVAGSPGATSLRDLFAIDVEGRHKPIPMVTTKFRDDQGRFSPDVKFIAYKSNETGRDEIYVQPFPAGAKGERWPISAGGGTMPRWSRDGRELYFISQGKLMVAPVQLTPVFHAGIAKELFTSPINGRGGGSSVCWDLTPDGKRFIVVTQQTTPQEPLTVVLNWPTVSFPRE
jgi:serine/threonine protein kinase